MCKTVCVCVYCVCVCVCVCVCITLCVCVCVCVCVSAGEENGFNVPQVRSCPEVGCYLSLSVEEISRLDASSLRDPVRRLLCDSYMCLYHCPQLSLYK